MATKPKLPEVSERDRNLLDTIMADQAQARTEARLGPQELASQQIMEKLAELGGQVIGDDDIVHEGTRFILPENITDTEALHVLADHIRAAEERTAFEKTFRYRPWDGAYALTQVIKKHFGFAIGKPTFHFFALQPPTLLTINLSATETTQVPWGALTLPMLPGATLTLGTFPHKEDGPLFQLLVDAPRKYKNHIEGIFRLLEEELVQHSIYRAKAIDGATNPNFLQLDGVDRDKVIYSAELEAQLEGNVWGVLRYRAANKTYGLPEKRAVVFAGTHGNGKTLAGYLTAKEAVAHDTTFIYCRPGQDNILEVMQTARLYEPTVVFFEDMDTTVDSAENTSDMSRLLDMLDGFTTKGCRILAVFTTNFPDRIQKAMLRPGRLDAVISFGPLDLNGVRRMVQANIPDQLLEGINYQLVYEAMQGFEPAFVKEAIDRTKRYSIARNGGQLVSISTEDLCHAASGLRDQLELMNKGREGVGIDHLRVGVGEVVQDKIRENIDQDYLAPVNGH